MAATSSAAVGRREERRLRQHSLSRNQLLDAAEEVFGTKGYHSATLREVAELAEFSVGSVYSFFGGKDDLYRHVFLRRGDEFVVGVRAVVEAGGPPLDVLRRLVEYEVGFFRSHPHFGRLYLRTASLSQPLPGDDDGEGLATFDEVMSLQSSVITSGQRSRALRKGDPAVLLRILSGIVTAFLSVDPAVTSLGADTKERLRLADLQAMVTAAFGVDR